MDNYFLLHVPLTTYIPYSDLTFHFLLLTSLIILRSSDFSAYFYVYISFRDIRAYTSSYAIIPHNVPIMTQGTIKLKDGNPLNSDTNAGI
jgi:hypothetical protein